LTNLYEMNSRLSNQGTIVHIVTLTKRKYIYMIVILFQNFADMTMEERKQFVARRCSEIKNQEMARKKKYMYTKPYYNMLFDKKHNLIACNNHKVGSSTIVAVLYNISGLQNVSSDSFRKEHLRQRLIPESINNSSAKAFMFVREPLQRLLSAYGNEAGQTRVRNVSFEMFLKNVLKEIDGKQRIDSHHMPFFQRCRPCDVEYDYVGTMETFDKDLKYILGQFGIDIDIVPRQNNEESSSDGEEAIKNVPMDIKRQIWERYKEDYVIFGYPNFIQTNDSLV